MMRQIGALIAAATVTSLAACGPRPPLAEPAAPAEPIPQAAAGPSIVIAAPGARVRTVIATRAQARGTTVASNTPAGVVLERQLAQSTETLEAQCGPHRTGRLIRVVLSTAPAGSGTQVSEQRFIVDGGDVCPVQLTPEDVAQANAGLQEIRDQVLATPRPAAAAPAAPATPRT
ncbi:hypothetical protein [Terrarubrum flagellatum]|uniref:hypothetical protein n=1 Tax=Terrirubrum flagellatum TaxID=2895980 RepID=UPI003145182A